MNILILDNHDSFTFNLFQLIAQTSHTIPEVHKAGTLDSSQVLSRIARGDFSHIVLGPGPGSVLHQRDFTDGFRIIDAVEQAKYTIPILGVCLGFQGLAHYFGGNIVNAPKPEHGHISAVRHHDNDIFQHIPQNFQVVRYHSLAIADNQHAQFTITAHATDDNVPMGLAVHDRPYFGVQFHPESILTQHDTTLIDNFLQTSQRICGMADTDHTISSTQQATSSHKQQSSDLDQHADTLLQDNVTKKYAHCDTPSPLQHREQVFHMAIPIHLSTEQTFQQLQRISGDAIFLDAAQEAYDSGRYSILAGDIGSLTTSIQYDLADNTTVVTQQEHTQSHHCDILEYLRKNLHAQPYDSNEIITINQNTQLSKYITNTSNLPFLGGYLGYLGYECKALTAHAGGRTDSPYPDARWLCPQSWIIFDHHLQIAHLFVRDTGTEWLESEPPTLEQINAETRRIIETLCELLVEESHQSTHTHTVQHTMPPVGTLSSSAIADKHTNSQQQQQDSTNSRYQCLATSRGHWQLSHNDYHDAIKQCHNYLMQGESYEICLTDTFHTTSKCDGWELYKQLRHANPTAYSCYQRWNSTGNNIEILSTSPERFLQVTTQHDKHCTGATHSRRIVTTKPIKGTCQRGNTIEEDMALINQLRNDPKTRAENLMIVDLLRNDLGSVCTIGTVSVPHFMEVETYATVHQLVTTIQGELRDDVDSIDLLQATFPGGSMTGAPKERTLELLDSLEKEPRGIYSGVAGYFAWNGNVDLNIIIRTAVKQGENITIGAGGAIVNASNAESEWEEKELKAENLRNIIEQTPTTWIWNRSEQTLIPTLRTATQHNDMIIDSWRAHYGATIDLSAHIQRFVESCTAMGYPISTQEKQSLQTAITHITPIIGDFFPKIALRTGIETHIAYELRPAPTQRTHTSLLYCADNTVLEKLIHQSLQESAEQRITNLTRQYPYYKGPDLPILQAIRKIATRNGYDDMLITNQHNNIVEASSGNIVSVQSKKKIMIVPPYNRDFLYGTTLRWLVQTAKEYNWQIVEKPFNMTLCTDYALWYCNALHGITEVTSIGVLSPTNGLSANSLVGKNVDTHNTENLSQHCNKIEDIALQQDSAITEFQEIWNAKHHLLEEEIKNYASSKKYHQQ